MITKIIDILLDGLLSVGGGDVGATHLLAREVLEVCKKRNFPMNPNVRLVVC